MLSMIPATKRKLAAARESFVAPLRNKGAVSSVVGGVLLGMGLTLSGTVSISLSSFFIHTDGIYYSVLVWCLFNLVEECLMQVIHIDVLCSQ